MNKEMWANSSQVLPVYLLFFCAKSKNEGRSMQTPEGSYRWLCHVYLCSKSCRMSTLILRHFFFKARDAWTTKNLTPKQPQSQPTRKTQLNKGKKQPKKPQQTHTRKQIITPPNPKISKEGMKCLDVFCFSCVGGKWRLFALPRVFWSSCQTRLSDEWCLKLAGGIIIKSVTSPQAFCARTDHKIGEMVCCHPYRYYSHKVALLQVAEEF